MAKAIGFLVGITAGFCLGLASILWRAFWAWHVAELCTAQFGWRAFGFVETAVALVVLGAVTYRPGPKDEEEYATRKLVTWALIPVFMYLVSLALVRLL